MTTSRSERDAAAGPSVQLDTLAQRHDSGAHTHVRELLAGALPDDLEDRAQQVVLALVPAPFILGLAGQSRIAAITSGNTRAGDRGTEIDRMSGARPDPVREDTSPLVRRDQLWLLQPTRQQRAVALAEYLHEFVDEGRVGERPGGSCGSDGPPGCDVAHPHRVRRERTADVIGHLNRAGAGAVDLVDEDQGGQPSRRSERIRTRVWAWTPSTADSTSTAPSRTARARSTSAMKSGWPGVSMRLTWRSPTAKAATAERMVIPRSRSRSPLSVRVVPASTLPSVATAPCS